MAAEAPTTEFTKKGKSEVVFTNKLVNIGMELTAGKVTKLSATSEFLGHIFCGDLIEQINGEKVKTTEELTKVINSKLPGKITIEYQRDDHCTFAQKPLPLRRAGFDQFEITLTWRSGGAPVGLLIHRNFSGEVVVAMVESGSTASKAIKPGDILVKINAHDVTDRDSARKKIMESINQTKKVTLVLERPQSVAALIAAPAKPAIEMEASVNSSASSLPCDTDKSAAAPASAPASASAPAPASVADKKPPPSDYTPTTYGVIPPASTIAPVSAPIAPASTTGPVVATPVQNPKLLEASKKFDVLLPADVLAIMDANRNFYKVPCTLPPCLKKVKVPVETVKIDILKTPHDESAIPFDQSPKPLKITPKRVGS